MSFFFEGSEITCSITWTASFNKSLQFLKTFPEVHMFLCPFIIDGALAFLEKNSSSACSQIHQLSSSQVHLFIIRCRTRKTNKEIKKLFGLRDWVVLYSIDTVKSGRIRPQMAFQKSGAQHISRLLRKRGWQPDPFWKGTANPPRFLTIRLWGASTVKGKDYAILYSYQLHRRASTTARH